MRKFLCFVAVLASAQFASAGVTLYDFAAYADGGSAPLYNERAYAWGGTISVNAASDISLYSWKATSIPVTGALPTTAGSTSGVFTAGAIGDGSGNPTATTGTTYAYIDKTSGGPGGLGATSGVNNLTAYQAAPNDDDNISALSNTGPDVEVAGFRVLAATDTSKDYFIGDLTFHDKDHRLTDFASGFHVDITIDGGARWHTFDVGADGFLSAAEINTYFLTTGSMIADITDASYVAFGFNDKQFYVSSFDLIDVESGQSFDVPEPTALACLLPIAGLAIARRRRKK